MSQWRSSVQIRSRALATTIFNEPDSHECVSFKRISRSRHRTRRGDPTGRGIRFKLGKLWVRIPLTPPICVSAERLRLFVETRHRSPTGRGARLRTEMLRVRISPMLPTTSTLRVRHHVICSSAGSWRMNFRVLGLCSSQRPVKSRSKNREVATRGSIPSKPSHSNSDLEI